MASALSLLWKRHRIRRFDYDRFYLHLLRDL
jgi:hypothetical protein